MRIRERLIVAITFAERLFDAIVWGSVLICLFALWFGFLFAGWLAVPLGLYMAFVERSPFCCGMVVVLVWIMLVFTRETLEGGVR